VAAKFKLDQTPSVPQQSAAPLPTKQFAAAYGVHPCTVWRAVRDGRLEYVVIGKRKLILPPVVQRKRARHADPNQPNAAPADGQASGVKPAAAE
jgi:hypothetical protein